MDKQIIELLKRLIATPRISRNETEAADLLQEQMQEWGLDPQRQGNNLWEIAPGYDAQRPTLLLNAHIDTVKPVNAWTRNPYTPELTEDGVLYGLGSNDDGASLVCLLATYCKLRNTQQTYNLIFVASAEEEVSGQNGISSVLPILPPISVALVGEPTGMQPAIAEKGLMVLDCTAKGKAGHAARNEGDNAIDHAIEDIAWFKSFRFPEESPLLGPVKMTVTIINAGTQHNVIPDTCTFTVDVRSNECYSNEDIYNKVRENIKSEVKARSFRLNSSRIDRQHPLLQRALALGKTPFGSPTLSDQALMHFPSMKMGPGDSKRSHTADEYIKISELEDALKTYFEMLNGLVLS
ncbi:MAG: M20 family metallo-hydrolase [Bacteroidaceae bacterium]|nr:M20 family metallo-hydrolase [Bacteroidaceae bacterium]